MQIIRPSILLTGALAACGDSEGSGNPKTVELDTIGPPTLVAVRQGDGAWQTVALAGNRYSIQIDRPYVVAVVCNDLEGLIDSYQFARTPDDEDPMLVAPCSANIAIEGVAQGTLAQAGVIAIGTGRARLGSAGGYNIPVANGPQELIATDDARIAVRRVQIAGPTAIPPLDLATDGMAFLPSSRTVTNAVSGELTDTNMSIVTEHGTFMFFFPSVELAQGTLIPDAVLAAADNQRVTVSADLVSDGAGTSTTASRSVFRAHVREATDRSYTLPSALAGATFATVANDVAVTFGDLPDHDSLSFGIDQLDNDGTLFFHDMDVSAAFAATASTIELDLDIPGFRPEWRIDLAQVHSRSFVVRKVRSADEQTGSSLFQTVNLEQGKPRRAQPRAISLEKPALAARLAERR
ncbi:MAG: hypothetical protein KIT31_31460 [Deltaproteobacteria bacterium]|nr:hypothetical protein [Deltaproteobacteria bacterium]